MSKHNNTAGGGLYLCKGRQLQCLVWYITSLERWKAVKFPDPIADYGFSEPNKILQKEVYTYAKEDNFNALFGLLFDKRDRVSSEEVLNVIFKHVAAFENSLLHVAASHGSEGVIQLLCHHFPLLITRKNFLGDNALHLAARAGRFDTIQNLVEHVDPHKTLELASFCDEEMLASFIEAMPEGNLEKLAVGKPDIVLPEDKIGGNLLHLAASMGFLSGARLLVSRCPVAASQSNEGNLPIHVACQKGHLEVVRELLTYWFDPMDLLQKEGLSFLYLFFEYLLM
ncbi:protein ACCELERATED CELL DEATH 6-like [Populus alba x Populus x berolinensis]|nr:protein ACCELERATED CELL DEATH 6-like [Populus alba x Populus x berolinensis]